jgi:quercetin dioxygenase-like cupin family protein
MSDAPSKYIRQIDFATFNADRKRFNQRLLDRSNSEIRSCAINYVRTPPNGGTPGGEHVHEYDQFMFLVSGKMMVKIDGEVYPVGPGTLMIYPAGVPHHFWNLDEETIHITVMAPAPDPEKPRATQTSSEKHAPVVATESRRDGGAPVSGAAPGGPRGGNQAAS